MDFSPQLPTSATATLGFLELNVTSGQGPQLTGDLRLGLNNINGTGRLSLADLTSTSAYSVGLNANANVRLKLDASFGGDTNLPQLCTSFYFTWSPNPTATNPKSLGFTDVTLDLAGFIDNIAAQIGSVLAPPPAPGRRPDGPDSGDQPANWAQRRHGRSRLYLFQVSAAQVQRISSTLSPRSSPTASICQ